MGLAVLATTAAQVAPALLAHPLRPTHAQVAVVVAVAATEPLAVPMEMVAREVQGTPP